MSAIPDLIIVGHKDNDVLPRLFAISQLRVLPFAIIATLQPFASILFDRVSVD